MIVIPAAGRGTRFAPYTHLIPKELLPLLNKPALSYIIDECAQAQLHDYTIITHTSKPLIPHFFIQNKITSTFVEQEEPLGLGHAILCAQSVINNSFFGICLPDDIIMGAPSTIGLLRTLSEQFQASIIAVQKISPSDVSRYGIIGIKAPITSTIFEVNRLVEKPTLEQAPSLYAIIGRYWLSRDIFACLKTISSRKFSGEIQLTDAIQELIDRGQRVLAVEIPGHRFDLGTPTGWLAANNALAQQQYIIDAHVELNF